MRVETFTLRRHRSGLYYALDMCVPRDKTFMQIITDLPQVSTAEAGSGRHQVKIQVIPTVDREELIKLLLPHIKQLVARQIEPTDNDVKFKVERTNRHDCLAIVLYDRHSDTLLRNALLADPNIARISDRPQENRVYFTIREGPTRNKLSQRVKFYCDCYVARWRRQQ